MLVVCIMCMMIMPSSLLTGTTTAAARMTRMVRVMRMGSRLLTGTTTAAVGVTMGMTMPIIARSMGCMMRCSFSHAQQSNHTII